ncbi:hypothetical protein DL95DRAFT_511786 [Leptodontidium sp. 2 PMI_412]|nr:hypothetical protein DL95DRAFT_511786 [Leptodontidium sp. 2 PMI_412]
MDALQLPSTSMELGLLCRDLALAYMAWDVSHRLFKVAKHFPVQKKYLEGYAARLKSLAMDLIRLAYAIEHMGKAESQQPDVAGLSWYYLGRYDSHVFIYSAIHPLLEELDCYIVNRERLNEKYTTPYMRVDGELVDPLGLECDQELKTALQVLEERMILARDCVMGWMKDKWGDQWHSMVTPGVFVKRLLMPSIKQENGHSLSYRGSFGVRRDTPLLQGHSSQQFHVAEYPQITFEGTTYSTDAIFDLADCQDSFELRVKSFVGLAGSMFRMEVEVASWLRHMILKRTTVGEATVSDVKDIGSLGGSFLGQIFKSEGLRTTIDYGRPKLRDLIVKDNALELRRGAKISIISLHGVGKRLVICFRNLHKSSGDAGHILVFWVEGNTEADFQIRVVKIFLQDKKQLDTLVVLFDCISIERNDS